MEKTVVFLSLALFVGIVLFGFSRYEVALLEGDLYHQRIHSKNDDEMIDSLNSTIKKKESVINGLEESISSLEKRLERFTSNTVISYLNHNQTPVYEEKYVNGDLNYSKILFYNETGELISYEYNDQDGTIKMELEHHGEPNMYKYTYYDSSHKITHTESYLGHDNLIEISYYNSDERVEYLESYTDGDIGFSIRYYYDEEGQCEQEVLYDENDDVYITTNYYYDAEGNYSYLEYFNSEGIMTKTYHFITVSNLTIPIQEDYYAENGEVIYSNFYNTDGSFSHSTK